MPDTKPTPAQKAEPSRRAFLKASAAGSLLPAAAIAAPAAPDHSEARIRRYNRLGRTGIELSDISFGSSRLRSGEESLVRHALDKGVNYFDTADSYTRGQSESVIGNALKGHRDRVTIVSKARVAFKETP